MVIAVANQKGGVGKTTVSFNLIKDLAAKGYRVLAIDNDPQGSLTTAILADISNLFANVLDIFKEDDVDIAPQKILENLHFIGADIRLAKMAEQTDDIVYRLSEYLTKKSKNYDFIIIDCLPSFGYLLKAALKAADYVLIPVKPSPFALMGLSDLTDTIDKIKRRINPKLEVLGIVLNLIEGKQTNLSTGLQEAIRNLYKDKVFKTELVKGVKFEESIMYNQSIIEYDAKNRGAKNFLDFTDELLDRLKEKGEING
jgi:chromosome partitioning protein